MTSFVRCTYAAVRVPAVAPPYDAAHLRIWYPADDDCSMAERDAGAFPIKVTGEALPVVIFLPANNVPVASYSWVLTSLAREAVVVSPTWVSEVSGGSIGTSGGLDRSVLAPSLFGQSPACPILTPILDALSNLEGPVPADALDFSHVVVGGHAAGGTAALLGADPAQVPGLKGVFSYAAHTQAEATLGWPPDTFLPIAFQGPLLMMMGSRDGVITGTSHRAAPAGRTHDPVRRTFRHGVGLGRPASYLATFVGANHMLPVSPQDPTTGRGFLDLDEEGEPDLLRADLVGLVGDFIGIALRAAPAAYPLPPRSTVRIEPGE